MEDKNSQTEEQEVSDEASTVEETIAVDEIKLASYIERIKLEQNLPMGIGYGIIAMLVSALLWATITVAVDYQIGYMAIGVGFIVGFAIRYGGKGLDQIYGISGASLALVGCALGNLLSVVGYASNANGMGYFEIIEMLDLTLVTELMVDTFNPLDAVFYGIALYYGYKLSFRRVTDEEIAEHAI